MDVFGIFAGGGSTATISRANHLALLDAFGFRNWPDGRLFQLAAIADVVCTPERAGRLARRHQWPPAAEVIAAWQNFILRDHDISRTYALQLIVHVDVHGERLVITPKEPGGRKKFAMLGATA